MNEEADGCLLRGRPNKSTHLLLFVFFTLLPGPTVRIRHLLFFFLSPIAPTFSIAPSKPQIRSGSDPKQTTLEGEEEEEEEEERDQTVRRRNQPSSAGAGAGAGGSPLVLSPRSQFKWSILRRNRF